MTNVQDEWQRLTPLVESSTLVLSLVLELGEVVSQVHLRRGLFPSDPRNCGADLPPVVRGVIEDVEERQSQDLLLVLARGVLVPCR